MIIIAHPEQSSGELKTLSSAAVMIGALRVTE